MVGGTCINLSKADGEIVNPYILLYDKNYVFDGKEEDLPKTSPKNVDVSDSKGTYRGYEFDRYSLADLGLNEVTLANGISVAVNSEAYSVKMRIKTLAEETYVDGRVRVSFFAQKGKNSEQSVVLKAKSITVGNRSISYTFAPDTEYDIEVGAVRMYGGNSVYIFLKINGELLDRWAVEEVITTDGNYFTVSKAGTGEFCQLI